MTPPKKTLVELQVQRAMAVHRLKQDFGNLKNEVRVINGEVVTLTCNHPVVAVGTLAAVGGLTGFFATGKIATKLAKSAGLIMIRQLINGKAILEEIAKVDSGNTTRERMPPL